MCMKAHVQMHIGMYKALSASMGSQVDINIHKRVFASEHLDVGKGQCWSKGIWLAFCGWVEKMLLGQVAPAAQIHSNGRGNTLLLNLE